MDDINGFSVMQWAVVQLSGLEFVKTDSSGCWQKSNPMVMAGQSRCRVTRAQNGYHTQNPAWQT
jgi:hypothetical protein